jgi:hypothetical protein
MIASICIFMSMTLPAGSSGPSRPDAPDDILQSSDLRSHYQALKPFTRLGETVCVTFPGQR